MLFLHDDALAELLEAFDDDGYCAEIGALTEGFFPFFFVIRGVGAKERGGVSGDGVVEVGMKG